MKIMLDRAASVAHISEVPHSNTTSRLIKYKGLSHWQAFGLGIISGFIGSGNPPSVVEFATCLGISKQGAHDMITVLKERGFITSFPGRVRSIRLTGNFKQGIEGAK